MVKARFKGRGCLQPFDTRTYSGRLVAVLHMRRRLGISKKARKTLDRYDFNLKMRSIGADATVKRLG
jgi:hypothetical protein